MSAFLGVIVGGVLALIGSFAAKIWDEWRQAVSLRGAFRAEIAGLLAIAEARKHEAFIEESIAAWKSGNDSPVNFFGLEHAGRVPVFTANVGAIGTIGRQLAEEVTAFYTQLLAVLITIQAFEDGKMQSLPLPARIALAEDALAIWRKAKAEGVMLVEKL
jgi:hypothetical protein